MGLFFCTERKRHCASVMIVEDEAIIALGLKQVLHGYGHKVLGIVDRGEDAVDMAERIAPDVVLMDIRLKGRMDGIEAARTIAGKVDTRVVFLSAYSDDGTMGNADEISPHGPAAYLVKPVCPDELQRCITGVIDSILDEDQ